MKFIYTFFVFIFAQLLSAQSFEGVVITKQLDANGVEHDISWFIKKDRLAFELTTNKSAMKMRFVPQPNQNSMLLVVTTPEGESKTEVAARDINAEIDMNKAEVKDNGVRNSAEYGVFNVLITTSATTITETEFSKLIDVDLSKYAPFFKNDYAVLALIKSGQSGFPLNSSTKDKNGKLISKTTLVSIRKMPVSESFFK